MHFDLETYNIQNYSEPMEQFFFAKILYLLNFGLLQNPLAWCFFHCLDKVIEDIPTCYDGKKVHCSSTLFLVFIEMLNSLARLSCKQNKL